MRRIPPAFPLFAPLLTIGCAYLIYGVVLVGLHPWIGDALAALSIAPVMIVAGLYGLRRGLLAAALTVAFNAIVLVHIAGGSLRPLSEAGLALGSLTLLAAAAAVGYLHDIRQQARRDLKAHTQTAAGLRESEQQFIRLFDQSPIGAAIVGLDGRILRANDAMCRMLGYTPAEISRLTVPDITAPQDMQADEDQFQRMLAGAIDWYQIDKRYVRKDGATIWGRLSVRLVKDDDGRPLYCLPMLEEITERKIADAAFGREAAFNAAMADLTHALITETSLEAISALFLEYAGRLTGSPLALIACLNEDNGSLTSLALALDNDGGVRLLEGETEKHSQILADWLSENGGAFLSDDLSRPGELSELAMLDPRIERLIVAPAIVSEAIIGHIALANSAQPYTEDDVLLCERLAAVYAVAIHQLQLEAKYRFMSMHDALTGLYNRAYFEEELERYKGSRNFPVSLLMCDLDGLKRVNDQQGHAAGDELLRRAATVLRGAFRPEDMVARIGGDEFIVALPHADEAVAASALARIRRTLAAHNQAHPQQPLALSLGAATAETSEALLEAFTSADEAMYLEKMAKRRPAVEVEG